MKKIFVIALAALSISFVSCTKKTVEEQAKEYAEQIMEAEKAGDKEKAAKISDEMEKWAETLSEEDQQKAGMAVLSVVMGDMDLDSLGDDVEEAVDEATEEVSEAVEDAVAGVEEAIEQAAE